MKECLNVLHETKNEGDEGYEEHEGEFYDAISGEVLNEDLVMEGRKVEMETFKKHGVYEQRPVRECWEKTGKKPILV